MNNCDFSNHNMKEEELKCFMENLGINKKIIEFKIGKKISDNCFNTNIDKRLVNKIIDKYQNYKKKKINNTIYYYHNKQLVILDDSQQKCYQDNNMEKIDIITSNMDARILTKQRERIHVNDFPCQKNYDNICQTKMVSISLQNNININIHNTQNIYEISIQYIHDPNKIKIQNTETLLSIIKDMEVY